MPDDSLAIVIPANRAQFLEAALKSIVAQTDQRFQLYVFDDASEEPIRDIAAKFKSSRPLAYHRFEDNLGARSLTAHWARCLELTTEPWVWLFSDDGEMEPECVATFWGSLEKTSGDFDLYRFNTRCINERSELVAEGEPYPAAEWGRDFLAYRLRGLRDGRMQAVIFRREAWKEIGGFQDFPLAWAADDAFIASMGKARPLHLLRGPRVRWRLLAGNLKGRKGAALLARKMEASRLFVAWARQFLSEESHSAEIPAGYQFSKKELDALTEAWFFRNLYYRRRFVGLNTCRQADAFARAVWKRFRGYGALKCMLLNFRWLFGAAGRKVRGRKRDY